MPTADHLFGRLSATGRLPTLPDVVVQVLDLARREDISVRQIADTLAHDPVLAAKILRFVNSPMAGVAHKVTSLRHAVALVGVRGTTMMALSFSVLASAGTKGCRGFDQRQFGVQSVGCGVAARALASATGTGMLQEAFLAGLFSQIGRAALAVGLPEEYSAVLSSARMIPRDLPDLEREALGGTYPAIGARLLRSWHIPEAVCSAIEMFRELDESDDAPQLTRVLHVGEVAASMICPDIKDGPPDSQMFVDAATTILGIEHEQCATLMNKIAREIEETRSMLEVPRGRIRSPADIELEVRECVAELTLAMRLANESLAEQQEELLRRATTDPLTGIGNRAAFDARMSLDLERSARSGTSFALLMIDVDKFKTFNDAYGHQAGDRVLRAVATTLGGNIRKIDFVARYGGEEFAVIAPDLSVEGAWNLAERLRRSVMETEVQWEGRTLRVTISIGVAVFMQVVDEGGAPHVLRAADTQLYAAKCAGRNRVELEVYSAPAAPGGVRSY